MEAFPASALSDRQFGFRPGKSTVDALDSVASFIYYWTKKNYFAISVVLDVRNAFNSIPWPTIRNAFERKAFPPYLRRTLDDYLNNRMIEYPVRGGRVETRNISCGVPQGSVLGPLLWNIAFNYIIEVRPDSQCTVLPCICTVYCYADDTMVLGAGHTVLNARSRTNDQVAAICR